MKKLTLKVSELMNPTVLNREQLKRVMGGDGDVTTGSGGNTSCKCTLKAPTGVYLDVPISSANSTTAEDCNAACKIYCDNAPSCASYSTVFADIQS